MVVIIALPAEFIRLAEDKSCSQNTSMVLKDFSFPSKDVENLYAALTQCEFFCSSSETCWGCSASCDVSCRWSAVETCEERVPWSGIIKLGISQKPGKHMFEKCWIIANIGVYYYIIDDIN